MYLYVRVCACVCLHVLVCMRLHVLVCACMCLYVCACMCLYVLVCACMYVLACACMCLYVLVCMCLHVLVCACMCLYVCACMCLYVLVCACMYVLVHDTGKLNFFRRRSRRLCAHIRTDNWQILRGTIADSTQNPCKQYTKLCSLSPLARSGRGEFSLFAINCLSRVRTTNSY